MDPVTFGDPVESTDTASPESTEESYSLLPGFLKNVPEQDRAIVSKYTKDWDTGVTQKFQEIHNNYKGQLAPFQQLGYDPDTLGRMIQFVDVVNTDPGRAYQALGEIIQNNNPELWQELTGGNGMEQEQEYEQDYGNSLDPAIQQLIEQQNQQIAELTQRLDYRDNSEVEAEQFAQFDSLLDGVLEKYQISGDDARDWVTLQIARGIAPEEAAKRYQGFTNELRNSQQTRPAPRIIGGQGGVPADQVDASSLRGEKRRDYVMGLLAQQQQG